MSTPYPPQSRRLTRDPSNKLIGGVCSGLAKYLNMDVNLVRILTVIISLFTGIPIVLYIIALFVMPEERPEQMPPHVSGPQPGAYGYNAQAYTQSGYGAPAPGSPPPPADPVWGPGGAPWEQPQAPTTPPATPPAAASAADQPTWPQQPAAETTSAPEAQPAEAPEPEPVPESSPAQPPAEEASDWESAPADPDQSDRDEQDRKA